MRRPCRSASQPKQRRADGAAGEHRREQQGQLIRRDVMRRRREHRRQRVAERRLDDVEQQAERAEDDDRRMQPRHGQAVEARRDVSGGASWRDHHVLQGLPPVPSGRRGGSVIVTSAAQKKRPSRSHMGLTTPNRSCVGEAGRALRSLGLKEDRQNETNSDRDVSVRGTHRAAPSLRSGVRRRMEVRRS